MILLSSVVLIKKSIRISNIYVYKWIQNKYTSTRFCSERFQIISLRLVFTVRQCNKVYKHGQQRLWNIKLL